MPLDLEKIDLGSFGVNESPVETQLPPGFESPIEAQLPPGFEQQTQLNANMTEAVKINPDQHSELTKLSEETGVPAFAIQSNQDQVEQQSRLNKIDLETLSVQAPSTARFLASDINNSIIAQEDVMDGTLEKLEHAITKVIHPGMLANIKQSITGATDIARSVPEGFIGGFGSAFEGVAETLDVGARFTARGLDVILPESFDKFLFIREDTPEGFRKFNQTIEEYLIPQTLLRWVGRDFKQTSRDIGVPEERQNVATDIGGAVGQVAQQWLTYAVNPSVATVGLFAQGVEQQAARQRKTSTIGEDVESDLALLTGGTITAISEKIGLDALLNRIPPKIKNDMLRRLTDIALAGGIEALQEVSENVAHGLLELQTTNPDAEIFKGIEREAIAAGGAGAIVRSIVNSLTKGRVRNVQDDESFKETSGQIEQRTIDEINKQSEKSKLRERNTESFKQFIREADGDQDSHVFVDGVQTALYLQGKTREEIEADPALKLLNNQLVESRATGADVAIPVADFAGDVAGTEHYTELREHMTMGEESISPFRQEQHREETQQYIRDVMAQAQENVSEYVDAQEIYTSVRDQLIDTGAVNAANASIMAQIVPAWATAQAARTGRSVADVYQSAGLTIEGPQTGERARLEGEQVFTQEPLFSEENRLINVEPEGAVAQAIQNENPGVDLTADTVTVHRATVGKELRFNDFVSLNEEIAQGHLKNLRDRGEEGQIITTEVPVSDLMMANDATEFVYVPQRATIEGEVTPDEQITRRPEQVDQRRERQETIDQAKARDDAEALAEFNQAKEGQQVTFVHRSFDDFTSFDDGLLGTNTGTPSGNLGHYLSAADIENVDRYGNEVSVHQFTFENPLVISPETFESVMSDLNPEEVMERRQALMDMGHDGILIEDLNWAIAFEGSTLTKLEDDAELLLAQAPVEEVSTETEEFKKWSGGGQVIEPESVNDHEFKADTPTVVKVFHGTTHEFSVFDALRGNLENQFGAVNYFTSSEFDAEQNYAGEGPDLTNRIEQRKEQIEQEPEEFGIDPELDPEEIENRAQDIAREELAGGQDQVMELFVRVDNPFVIGENAEWIEFVDNEVVQTEAIERVAENNDITVDEVNENIEDFEDQINDIRWELELDTEHPLIKAIQTVADRHDADAAELAGEVYDLGSEATPQQIEELIRGNKEISYAEDPETSVLIQSQMIAEIIEEMGFDSIILKDAEQRFENMEMEPGTAHVHIFDSNKTNIKSVQNIGTFDPTDPDIFRQPGEAEARGYYDPANSVIRLTEAADLSTFLHEFAHFMYEMEATTDTEMNQNINSWFKRNGKDVAKEATDYLNKEFDAEKQGELTTESKTVTEEEVIKFLDEGTTGNKDKDSSIRRATHEQFARGFEAYLMEGKSPSVELRNAFRTFARWLAQIYQALRGTLQVNLDNEMRQVFDRLVATEEQIAAAESRARVEPMFTDAAMAGMTEKQFADYKKRVGKVKDVQSETLREQMIKQLTRQTKRWWNEEKSDLVDEELDSLASERVYAAATRLRDGDIKLDHAAVKEMTGVQRTDKLGRVSTRVPDALRGMTAKGKKGVHPDEAAAFFGYDSGSELLNELSNSPKMKDVAEQNAEVRMIERHGDILNDGTIEQRADEAVQNEERGRLLLHELKMVSRGTNQRVLDRQTMKSMSAERIGQLSFREIHPGKYRKAEINAAQEASRMLAEGNKEGAAQAKARQVLNYYLGMAATEAKNETAKIVDRMARYSKKKVREEIQKAEGGYWGQIVKILERFEFKKSATLTSVDQVNQNINTWAKERTDVDGDGLVLHNAVLNESFVTHWKNVSFNDLQGINDSVKNIEHVARYANKLTRMGEEIEFNKLVDRWVTHMDENVKTRFQSKRTDVVEGKKWGRWLMAQMTKIPVMASWLDGGERAGISHQVLVQPFTDAYNAELKLWEQAGKPVMEAIEGRSKEDMKRHNRKIFIPEINDHLYGHQVIAVALNTGNESNLRKLLLGEQWANPDNEAEISFQNNKLQAVLNHMTESDWRMVQKIWDQMETLYPQLSEVHRRTTGLVPPKVEAVPVQTPFGEIRGGYYPIKYDPNRSHRAALNEDRLNAETESMFSNNASIQTSVNTGSTNERTGFYDAIRLSLDVVPAHFQETIHYITHHDPVREINKLTRDARVSKTIKEKLGPEEYAQLKPWLNDIAKDGREAPTKMFWDDILQRLRFGVTLGAMGFKASTGIIQISGLSNTIAEVGMANTVQSLRSILGSTTTMKQAWEFAKENSKVLEHRAQTMDREIKNAMKRIESKRGVIAAVQEASMKHIALIQTYMVDLPSWHAAYIKEMKESGDETKAFQHADWVIENVQGSGATKDLARIMRGQSETGRMFTMFMTFFSSLWNMERDLVKGARSGRYSPTNVAAKSMFLFSVPVLFEMLMRGELSQEDEDDDDRLQKMLTKTAMYPLQSMPFIRDIANAVTGEFGYNISPLQAIIEQGTRTIPEVIERGFTDEEITKGQAKGATKFVGAAVGIPGTSQAWATGEHLHDVIIEGEEFTLHQLLFGPERKK